MPGARLTRHELKTQDEITSSLQNFSEFIEAKKKEVLIAAAAVVIVVLAVVGWRTYSGRRNAAASIQLGSAIAAFEDTSLKPEKARYEKSAAEAQKTVDQYGSSPAGTIARYYLGMSQARLGDAGAAEKSLQDVVDHGSGTIQGIAQFALAQVEAGHGESAKAIENLTQLYNSAKYPKSAVAYTLASLYEAGSQKEQAKQYYSKVITDSPDSGFRQDSETALKRMGVPVPVPPAPAPVKP